MSATPDPSDLAPSRDPVAYGRRPLLTAGFFVWLGLCAACLVAGVVLGRFGLPRQIVGEPPASLGEPPQSAPAAPPQPAPAAPPTNETPPQAAETDVAAPPPVAAVEPGDLAVSERVARLEARVSRIDTAAAEALAAAQLSAAAQGSAPFGQDVAAYERLAPGDADLAALGPLAARGAPSRAALAAAFPDVAALAAQAAREPGPGASFLDSVWWVIDQVVIVRKVDPGAPGVDGALARAEEVVSAGDLDAAVRDLATLPPKARGPLADWLAAAERRVEIDRHVARLRARALATLAAAPATGPQ